MDHSAMTPKTMVQLIRPSHWTKNVLVLAPVVFAMRVCDPRAWCQAALAAAAFCLASSASYVFNDIHDRERDLRHPAKSTRPLAAGRVSVRAAAMLAVVLVLAALGVALAANCLVLVVVVAYLLLQAAYTLVLKHRMLLDVICIALGFVLRALAGAVAIPVVVSPWLFVCTFTVCLFMGFCKRCNEIATMGGIDEAGEHRFTLTGYKPELLTHLITLSAALAIMGFLLYASSGRTMRTFGTNFMIYTLPLVIYGVFRFAMLSMRGSYADPMDIILNDRPFQVTVLVWIAAVVVVIYWGQELQEWARCWVGG